MMGGSKRGVRGVSSCKRGCPAKKRSGSLGRVVMQKRSWKLVVGGRLNSGMGGQKGRAGHQGAKDGWEAWRQWELAQELETRRGWGSKESEWETQKQGKLGGVRHWQRVGG